MAIIKASVIQACTVGYDLGATLEKLERLAKLAKERDGSQLALFPEAFIGGYPKGRIFGCVVGSRTDEGRNEYLDYFNSAVSIPGPAIDRVERIASSLGMFIVTGVIEKDHGTLYCSVVWVHPELGLVGKRRKLMPTGAEKLIWGQGKVEDVKLVSTSLPASNIPINISTTICWENYMPLFRQRLYELGTQIYCAPTVDGRDVWEHTMRHIAIEGRVFVLSANQFSQVKDHPKDHDFSTASLPAQGDDTVIAGGSMIVDPFGKVLAGPLRGQEGVLSAELDLDDIIRGKLDLDVTGHYARADIFKLTCG